MLLAAFLLTVPVAAQELTIEYNIGYGTYKMDNLKEVMEKAPLSVPVKNLKVTDNFPGYITHQVKFGVEWRKLHQAGISLDYMNTVWNKGVSDYSASYNLRMRVKGFRFAPFYRFVLPDFREKAVKPYLQLTTGMVFNNGKLEEEVVSDRKGSSSETLKGVNFFVEPAVGLTFRLHKMFALNVNAGYQFDLAKNFRYKGQKVQMAPDWSGLRVQGGLIYYIPL